MECWILNIIYFSALLAWAVCFSFFNDKGLVVLDERGYILYVLNKWERKVIYTYPLDLSEIESSISPEVVERKKTAHLHLYVKEKYYHVIVSRKTLGLRKQLESYKVMHPDFLEKTFRKDMDFKNFEVNQYVQD